jgi:hypothetical protein
MLPARFPQCREEDVRSHLYRRWKAFRRVLQFYSRSACANLRKAQPLIEPSVIPLTKSRIEKVKRTITGILAMA